MTLGQTANSAALEHRHRRLGEALCRRGLINEQQFAEALARRGDDGTPLGERLIRSGAITRDDLVRTQAELVGKPFMHLTSEHTKMESFGVLPEAFLEQHNAVPLQEDDGVLTIAVEDFMNVVLIDEIARQAKRKVRVVAAMGENIREARRAVARRLSRQRVGPESARPNEMGAAADSAGQDGLHVVADEPDEVSAETSVADSPAVALVNQIIKSAVDASASDIHIEPGEPTFRVRYRIDGDLVATAHPPARMLPAVVSRIKILAGMDISQRRLPQDGGVTVKVLDRAVDLRISSMASKFGEKVVIRIVDRDAGIRSLTDIGLGGAMLEQFREAIREPHGVVLVTGPTGSGKSTTLYGALAEIVTEDVNVSTIEDPIERVVAGVNQFQIQSKAGFTFSSALRSMLRQDPDVILVGEVRDAETARLTIEAALTGHLVLSTLHTNDALAAIPRLVNMGVESYLVAATLRAVLAQRLVRRLCASCSQPRPLSAVEGAMVRRLCGGAMPLALCYSGAGCHECLQSGMKGRVGVFDLLVCDDELVASVAEQRHARLEPQTKDAEFGTSGLITDGLRKASQGVIAVDRLLEIASRMATAPKGGPVSIAA